MKELTLYEENELLKEMLETYAGGLEDHGLQAAERLKYIALFEISKQCTRCGDLVPESAMRKDNRREGGLGCWCKTCDREDNKMRRSMKHKPTKALEISLKKLEKLAMKDLREISFQWGLVWKNIERIKNE